MRQELLKLYQNNQNNFKNVRNHFPNDPMHGPFLISPNDKYAIQPLPLLIIGQETFGWGCEIDDIEKQMAVYEKFNVGETYKPTPFWNVTRKVEEKLGHEKYSCAQTNINKFDVNRKHPVGPHENTIASLEKILITEISILKPKICIFFTGPSLDNRLNAIFPSIKFLDILEFNKREFCQLKHELLPELSFRAYHPGYLRRKGKEKKFLDFIVKLSISN